MPPTASTTLDPRTPPWVQTAQLLALWLIAAIGAVAVFRAYDGVVFDDSFITYRYARNLADGVGFVFQAGDRVLGTTTPLYTMLLGLGGWLGADIPTLSGVLFAAAFGAVAVIGGTLLRQLGSHNAALLYALACMAGFSHCFRFWGLETPLVTAFVLGAVLAAHNGRDLLAGVLAALAFLTRYDAALFAILLFLALAIRRRRVPWVPGLVATAIVLPWLVFSQLYFGSFLPNTLAAKVGEESFLGYLWRAGAVQVGQAWQPLQELAGKWVQSPVTPWVANIAVAVGILLALIPLWKRAPLVLLLVAYPIALWLGYGVIGPPLAFRWYLVPATLILLLAGMIGWGFVLERVSLAKTRAIATLALVALTLFVLPSAHARSAVELKGHYRYRSRLDAYATLGDWVIANDLTDKTLLTLEPGYFTYRTGNPAIDAAGLVTKGVYFHGHGRAQTTFPDLIALHEPPLIVTTLPSRPPGYVLVCTAFPYMQLLMRAESHGEHFDVMAANFTKDATPPGTRLLQHPFNLDVERTSHVEWREQGGEVPFIGRRLQMTIDGGRITDDYLYLRPGMTGAQTPPFRIDFDQLAFRFAARNPFTTVAQLVIDGRIVLEQGGAEFPKRPDFARVAWPVHPWRGRVGQLRFVNADPEGAWLAADHIRSVVDDKAVCFDDFEAPGDFGERWEPTDFATPTNLELVAREHGVEFQGLGHAATTRSLQGPRTLSSKPFLVEHDYISFIHLDFGPRDCAIFLFVDGKPVAGLRGNFTRRLKPVTWDLRAHRGGQAVLRLIDRAPDHWIGIDEIHLGND